MAQSQLDYEIDKWLQQNSLTVTVEVEKGASVVIVYAHKPLNLADPLMPLNIPESFPNMHRIFQAMKAFHEAYPKHVFLTNEQWSDIDAFLKRNPDALMA